MRLHTSIILLGAVAVLCTACAREELPPLPEGIQTIEGLLKPAGLSTIRRGTHVIEIDGEDTYYAESTVVPLRTYQGKHVTLRGTLEHNVDATYLPVLVVDSLLDVEETSMEHQFPTFSLSITTPIHWKPVKAGDSIFFTLGEGGPVIMTFSAEAGDELPESGQPIVVGAKRATKLTDALTGNIVVSVQQTSERILSFSFTADESADQQEQLQDFETALDTVEFTERTSLPTITGTGAVGTPCGGAAGILCPAGMFCEITNFSENIGRCKGL